MTLNNWNWNIFGNVDKAILEAKSQLVAVQECLDMESFFEALFNEDKNGHAALDELLVKKECMLRDKCHVSWLEHGYRNSAFFYSLLHVRKASKPVQVLNIGGVLTSDMHAIIDHTMSYFSAHFNVDGVSNEDSADFNNVIPSSVTEERILC